MRFSLARIMTHRQSHHGQPPTKLQVGQKRAKQAGKVRIPKRTLRKSNLPQISYQNLAPPQQLYGPYSRLLVVHFQIQ
jgi:hypothetical protein